jgi:hypothetical protein
MSRRVGEGRARARFGLLKNRSKTGVTGPDRFLVNRWVKFEIFKNLKHFEIKNSKKLEFILNVLIKTELKNRSNAICKFHQNENQSVFSKFQSIFDEVLLITGLDSIWRPLLRLWFHRPWEGPVVRSQEQGEVHRAHEAQRLADDAQQHVLTVHLQQRQVRL